MFILFHVSVWDATLPKFHSATPEAESLTNGKLKLLLLCYYKTIYGNLWLILHQIAFVNLCFFIYLTKLGVFGESSQSYQSVAVLT